MHPGFFHWLKKNCGPSECGTEHHDHAHGHGGHGRRHGQARCGPHEGGRHAGWAHRGGGHGHHDEGGGFGVRRPLRFLAWKLELEEDQVEKLATILDQLKTERAQAAVDERRSIAALADAVEPESFDQKKAQEAGDLRVKSAEALRRAVLEALERIHGLLDAEQRRRLAYLLRTGALSI